MRSATVLMAITILMATIFAVASAQASCSDPAVKGLLIDTPKNVYGTATTITLDDITVRTVGNIGQFVHTGTESVTVSAPSGYTLGGTVSGTTSSGSFTFSGLTLSNPPQGTFYLDFTVCGGVRTDKLEVVITAGSAEKIIWFTEPENSITSFGYFPLKPVLAMADNSNVVTDLTNFDTWTLETNDTEVILMNNQFTPNSVSGQLVPFNNLQIYVNTTMTGRIFELRLASIGAYTSASPPPGVTWPAPVNIRVAECNHDFTITPGDSGATLQHFNIPVGTTDRVRLRGWNFMASFAVNGRCRYNNLVYPFTFVDLCNIECNLPASLPANGGYPLELSLNGVAYEYLGNMVLVDESTTALVPDRQKETIYREDIVSAKFKFRAVDKYGRDLNNRIPNSPPSQVICTSNSLFANQKRIHGVFLNPKTNLYEVPVFSPNLVDGEAIVDFVFGQRLEPDIHRFCCNTSTINGGCIDIEVIEECTSPPFIGSVTSQGCEVDATDNLFNCKTQGLAPVIVTGGNFGFSGATIRIGPYECGSTVHDSEFPTRILHGIDCKGAGAGHTVYVFREEEKVYAMHDKNYSYGLVPIIDSIVGCPDNFYPSTANCNSSGESMVQITGANFGTPVAGQTPEVHFYYYVPLGATVRITATTVVHISDTLINATGFPGEGSRFEVAVNTTWGELTRQPDVTMTYTATVVLMCPTYNGVQCNGKGDCNTNVGDCKCFNDDVNGRWVGSACENCQATYYGATCASRCPGGEQPCSGPSRGTCSQGVTGDGVCTCVAGYGGFNCNITCPGGASSPCSNRGTCIQGTAEPTCNCTADVVNGFWGSGNCSVCATGYVGATCTQQCPTHYLTPTIPCNGHGQCKPTSQNAACLCDDGWCGESCGYTGTDCGGCPPGKYGQENTTISKPACNDFCPGYQLIGSDANLASDVVYCGGTTNGRCQEGQQGTGQCICNSGFAGSACELACPVFDGLTCAGNGQCSVITGSCECNPAYAGGACNISCPGLNEPAGICSGKGTCNSGSNGTGLCQCNPGYTAAKCDEECPGGAASPCSFHGICGAYGTCDCDSNQSPSRVGFWMGDKCSNCQPGWYGPDCNGQCVKVNNLQCAGHGQCSHELDCICYANVAQGYWALPDCAKCKENYWGTECTKQCPGGACNACSNHGTCSDGTSGDGTCTCHSNATAGYWEGDKCERCKPSYYGEECQLRCPVDANEVVCFGHGVCSEGVRGNGTCICTTTDADGFWGGANCDTCKLGYYGPDCKSQCEGTGEGYTCSGHGTCDDGVLGSGVCTCAKYYGTSDCSVGCYVDPSTPTTPCSGHGTCDEGSSNTGNCICYAGDSTGYWDGDTCGDCLSGYYGSSCISQCPTAYGQTCGGNGTCDDGTSGSGVCACNSGYALSDCSIECNGGAADGGCSGHGDCDASTGSCTCHASDDTGYWSTSDCSVCDPMYDSITEGCTLRCPTADYNSSYPCTGHGICLDGKCQQCDEGFCGDRCENYGYSCSEQCKSGYWGDGSNPAHSTKCEGVCQGMTTDANGNYLYSCSNNGICKAGLDGDGTCSCYPGFYGGDCSGVCLPNIEGVKPCYGHGICDRDTGVCQCSAGWATSSCGKECPGGAKNTCSFHGACNAETGDCDCFEGYSLPNCSALCPGAYHGTDEVGQPKVLNICSNHGACNVPNSSCVCHDDATNGHWDGVNCSVCKPGWHGANCDQVCINGVTDGVECKCDTFWSGHSCDHQCPGMGQGNTNCSGHGNCLFGNQYNKSTCVCDEYYFTESCSVRCTPDECKREPHLLQNGKCNNETGKCDCAQNEVDGYWADKSTKCTTCKLFYWGEDCKKKCPCMQHGGCDKVTGACQCFDTDAQGHFDGNACERCKAGYIGSKCKGKDVVVTRQRPCSSIKAIKDRSQFILMDQDNDVIITGARPVIICSLSTKREMGSIDLNATVVAGTFKNKNFMQLTLNNMDSEVDPHKQMNVLVRRLPGGDQKLEFVQQGKPFTFDRAFSTTSRRRLTSTWSPLDRTTIVEVVEKPVASDAQKERFVVYSNGVVQWIRDLDRVGEYYFDSNFTEIQSAAITDSILISPSYLVLGGTYNGEWRMIAVPLPLSLNGIVVDINSMLSAKGVQYCSDGACKSVAKIVTEGTYIVAAMLTTQGAGIMRFRFTQLDLPDQRVETNAILEGLENTKINVTAMILDPLSGAGFVAINYRSETVTEPSTIYKFDLLNLQVYGSVRFQRVVNTYEIVSGFTKDDVNRTLYATVPLEMQLNVVPLNLYAVTKVYPEMADIVGGTVITVEGEGFMPQPFIKCDFNISGGADEPYIDAEFISTREARCVAPAGGDERCDGTPLEVSVGPSQFTKNDIKLRRVSSPRIHEVFSLQYMGEVKNDNAYGNLTGGETVVLKGIGFQESLYLACRFTAEGVTKYAQLADRDYAYSNGLQGVLYNKARFKNATAIECDQPQFDTPTRGAATVEVTLDGIQYSRSGMRYEVVGQATGIRAFKLIEKTLSNGNKETEWTSDFTQATQSADTVVLDDFHIFTVDENGQRLRSLDTTERRITMELYSFEFSALKVGTDGNSTLNFTDTCDYPPTYRNANPIMHMNATDKKVSTMGVEKVGYARFSGAYFLRPPAGTYTFRFTDHTTGWVFDHPVTMNVGKPKRLRICKEPPHEMNNLVPALAQQPVIYVEDLAGNQIPGTSLGGVRVQATYLTEHTETTALSEKDKNNKVRLGVPTNRTLESKEETRVAQLSDNFLQFEGLEMKGLHGKVYHINFSATFTETVTNATDSTRTSTITTDLESVLSHEINVAWCRNNTAKALDDDQTLMYFAMEGTSDCFVCPDGGYCDGTTTVRLLRNNLYRPDNTSYKFYSCEVPYSGNSCIRPEGTCKEGYTGPRCSVCTEGYGKDGFYCKKCPSKQIVASYMLLLLVITLAFVTLLVYTSFTASLSETLPVLIKIAINHLQISSRINEIILMPQALQDLFNAQLQISELVRFDLVSTECPPLELTVYGRFYLVICIPAFMMTFYGIVFMFLAIYRKIRGIGTKCTPIIPSERSQEIRRDRVMLTVAKFMARIRGAAYAHHGDISRDDLRPQFYTSFQYFTATSVIILFLVYPSVLQWAASMWRCDDIVFGHGNGMDQGNLHTVSYLSRDRSIVCTDSDHRVVQAWALAAALVYGIGVPAISILIVYRHWRYYGRVHARRLFAFIMLGFDITAWFWEAAVMVRKALIVFIIIFIGDSTLRTYLAMWTMALALGAHGWFQPYDPTRPSLYYLEGLGITTIVVTLNLSLLFQFDQFSAGTAYHDALVIFLFAINVLVCVVFLFLILHQLLRRIKNIFTGGNKDDAAQKTKDIYSRKMEGHDDVDMDNLETQQNEFSGVTDRRSIQKEGILGALRKASKIKELQEDEANLPVINPSNLPARAGETPFERVQRMEQERQRAYMRHDQAKTQIELEEELEELRDRLVRAQALAAAEEAVIARNPEMAIKRQEHEDQLMRLMDEIRKERGEIVVKNEEHNAFSNEIMQSIQFENEDDEVAFEDDDEVHF